MLDFHLQETVATIADALVNGSRLAAREIDSLWRYPVPAVTQPGVANEPMDEDTSIVLPGEAESTPTAAPLVAPGDEGRLLAGVSTETRDLLTESAAMEERAQVGVFGLTLILSGLSPLGPGQPQSTHRVSMRDTTRKRGGPGAST